MLIAKHGAGRIAPFSLLVPVFGMASWAALLGEEFDTARLVAAGLILGGLGLTLWRPHGQRQVGDRACTKERG